MPLNAMMEEALSISLREGMDHFAEFLVDYDEAININMWMNAGCVGFDPYYVGMNYKRRSYWDNNGDYVRTWCPELRDLPDFVDVSEGKTTKKIDCLYNPWAAPIDIIEKAGVMGCYPDRVCDDRKVRSEFFALIRELRARDNFRPRIDDKKRDIVRLGREPTAEVIGMFTPLELSK